MTIVLSVAAIICAVLHMAGVSPRVTAGLGILCVALIPIAGRLIA